VSGAENIEQMIMSDTQRPQTHLFTVRVWLADLGDGRAEWRGQVRHVISGRVRYFRDWPSLTTIVQEMLAGPEEAAQDKQTGNGARLA
jgi:hypothetical protein